MLQFSNVTLSRGPKILFEHASFQIHNGQRVGISGANGTGKSSLMALVRGELQVETGDFSIPPSFRLAHVAQETPALECSALDYVLDGDDELRDIQRAIDKAHEEDDGEAIAHHYDQLSNIGGYEAEARAARLLSGLGFQESEIRQAVSTFSGGWRMRLNLAQALMCRSDVLLLDEPTNHLDLDAIFWLEDWLLQYQGTVLLISHDRDFLDAVAQNILYLERQQATMYSGNYSQFERTRSERLAQQQQQFEKQQREREHIQSYVDRFRAKATKAKQAQSRLKQLERMADIAPAHVDSPFHFRFFEPDAIPSSLLSMSEADIGYAQRAQIEAVDLSLLPTMRVGLLGRNGAGKSTLMKALSGELSVISGERQTTKHCKIGYFAQHQLDSLDLASSAYEHLHRRYPKLREQEIRNFLGGFGFQGDRVFEIIEPFSGGEKARLALALVVYEKPNLLLLDEPTNHLDLEMRQALAQALQEYAGALVVVSHDGYLLRSVVDEFWLVEDHRLKPFDGDLDDYHQYIKGVKPSVETTEKHPAPSAAKQNKKQQRQEAAAQRELLNQLKKRLKRCERKLMECEREQADIEALLADSTIYDEARKDELQGLLWKQAEISKSLQQSEAAWMEATEELEQATKG